MSSKGFLSFLERTYSLQESDFIKRSFIRASEVFEGFGYNYLSLPIFEREEEQREAIGERAKESITFSDTLSGELISLRRDFTTLVVRTLSRLEELNFPKRIFYFGKVVSIAEEGYESYQTGIELMGESSIEGDAEVITAISEFLKSLGVKNFLVSVGHVGITGKLLSENQDTEGLREALIEKNLSFLRKHVSEDFLLKLPLMQGGNELLEELTKRGFDKEARELYSLGQSLEAKGIRFIYDLSEVGKLPYYTGIVFEVYHESLGFPVASGGRYDKLSRLFGKDFPATGGAVYLDRLYEIIKSPDTP